MLLVNKLRLYSTVTAINTDYVDENQVGFFPDLIKFHEADKVTVNILNSLVTRSLDIHHRQIVGSFLFFLKWLDIV